MNLRQLEHVVALAEDGSFARAALRVHLTQPALSRSIRAIEDELDMVLFDRTTREVKITPTGQIVVQRAKRILFETRGLVRDVDLLKNHRIGSVSFGAGPYPAAVLLPSVLSGFAQSHPKLKINASVDRLNGLLAALRSETLDFVVVDVRSTPPSSEFELIVLPKLHAAWFVREGHPLAGIGDLETRHLHNYPIVSVPLPDAMREGLRKWLRCAPNHEIEFQLVCNDVHLLKDYTRQTDSLLLLTNRAPSSPSRNDGLVALPVQNRSPLWLQFAVVHLAGRTLSPAAQEAVLAIQRAGEAWAALPD
jgi:DNA-binding transcriptional LysR family regulator